MIEVISPFPQQSLPRVWQWIESFRNRVVDDYSPQTLDAFVRKSIEDQGTLQTWAVYRDGELGGMVSFEKWTEHLGTAHCLFKREMWGRKTTRPALEQILQQIFAGSTRKLCMNVFSDNQAIIALVKELGAVTEAHYSEHTKRNGKLVAMTGLALFKKGFEQHAGASDSSRDRGRKLHHRGSALPAKDLEHVDDNAQLVAGGHAAPGPAALLLLGPDDGSICRSGAD
jgi:RimJ/RimL family protein N-acetyltransferase